MPLMNGLVVGQSKIHGYGIIATRPFKKGDRICIGDGVVFDENDDFDDTYALVYTDSNREEGVEPENQFYDLVCQTRWINHSCKPNAEVDTAMHPEFGRPYAWWTALTDIAPGDEITYDYAFVAEVAERCYCQASNCRGLIIDEDEVHLVPLELKSFLRAQAEASTAVSPTNTDGAM